VTDDPAEEPYNIGVEDYSQGYHASWVFGTGEERTQGSLDDRSALNADGTNYGIYVKGGQPQTLILDEKDIDLIRGRRVVTVDDVVSTGSTLQGIKMVLDKAGATVAGDAAIFTEGDRAQWMHIIALGHLPLFTE